MVEKQPNGNGKRRGHEPELNEASARHDYPGAEFHYRPVLAGEADVLNVPLRVRLRWGWRSMVRESAKLVGAKQETRLRYLPVASIILSVVLAAAATVMAYGVFKGRTDANEEIARENRAVVARQIEASQAVMLGAANEIKGSMEKMRAELAGEVATIRSMVGATQADMARAEAKIESLGRENERLRVDLDVEEMRRQKLENQLRAQGVDLD